MFYTSTSSYETSIEDILFFHKNTIDLLSLQKERK